MKRMLRVSLAVAALSTAVAFASPAGAARLGDLDEAGGGHVVRYQDLDTSKEADMRDLYARIKSAAHSACRAADSAHLGAPFLFRERCVGAAVDKAVARANHRLLVAIHNESRSGLAAAK
jgi:UrcA family protein